MKEWCVYKQHFLREICNKGSCCDKHVLRVLGKRGLLRHAGLRRSLTVPGATAVRVRPELPDRPQTWDQCGGARARLAANPNHQQSHTASPLTLLSSLAHANASIQTKGEAEQARGQGDQNVATGSNNSPARLFVSKRQQPTTGSLTYRNIQKLQGLYQTHRSGFLTLVPAESRCLPGRNQSCWTEALGGLNRKNC